MFSREGRVLFTHVSRTAGVAITESLRRALPDLRGVLGQHDPLIAGRPILGQEFDETFKFAIVRNPWDRFVSWYALIGQTQYGDSVDPASLADPSSDHWKGFDEFLEQWASETIEVEGVTFRTLSQWAQLSDLDGVLLTDDLGRFESIDADCERLFGEIGLNWRAPARINTSSHEHYSVYYSTFGRELVEHVFQDDIAGFGYQFSAPSM